MQCRLLLPGMFQELAAAAPCPPALQAVLRYARRVDAFAGDADAWRCRFFGVARQQDWPVAPFSCLGDGLEPGADYWLCAHPVHLHLRRDSLTVADAASFALDMPGAQQLVAALNAHFADDGMRFFAPHPSRWYLRLAAPPMLETHPLAEAVGRNVDRLLPQGRDALQWHGRLNEIQMLLHEHPVNLDLERRGELPVNSVWLWGGGVLPPCAASGVAAVWAHDPFTRGLAQAHGAAAAALPLSAREWLESGLQPAAHLVVPDQLAQAELRGDPQGWREALERLERHWFAPLLQALRDGRIASLGLHLAGARRVNGFCVTRADLHKFWRRSRPLGAYLG